MSTVRKSAGAEERWREERRQLEAEAQERDLQAAESEPAEKRARKTKDAAE